MTTTTTPTELIAVTTEAQLRAWLTATSRNARRGAVHVLDDAETTALWHAVGTTAMAELFASVGAASTARRIADFSPTDVGRLLSHLPFRQAADVLREMAPRRATEFREALAPQHRAAVDELLTWPADSAGANMTPAFLWLPGDLTAVTGIESLRRDAARADASAYIYVLGGGGELQGVLSFRELVTAEPHALLRDVARPASMIVPPTLDREDAATVLHDRNLTALPVVDDGVLRGVITADRAAEIMAVEITEDFQRMSPAGDLRTSIKDASVWMLYRSRVVWLLVLVFGNLFSGAGIAYYEDLIAEVVSLVFFLPLLIDSGGNAGSQSATLVVRALATGQVQLRDWFGMLAKELAVAALLGLSMAAAVSVLGIWRGGPEVALVVSLTMMVVVLVGSVIGMSLPFVLTKLRLDPASASAPLITSIADGVGVVIYFFIASQLLL